MIFIQCKNYYGYILKYHTEENMPMVIKMYMKSSVLQLISVSCAISPLAFLLCCKNLWPLPLTHNLEYKQVILLIKNHTKHYTFSKATGFSARGYTGGCNYLLRSPQSTCCKTSILWMYKNCSKIVFKITGCTWIVLILFLKYMCCQPFSLLFLPGLVILFIHFHIGKAPNFKTHDTSLAYTTSCQIFWLAGCLGIMVSCSICIAHKLVSSKSSHYQIAFCGLLWAIRVAPWGYILQLPWVACSSSHINLQITAIINFTH